MANDFAKDTLNLFMLLQNLKPIEIENQDILAISNFSGVFFPRKKN